MRKALTEFMTLGAYKQLAKHLRDQQAGGHEQINGTERPRALEHTFRQHRFSTEKHVLKYDLTYLEPSAETYVSHHFKVGSSLWYWGGPRGR